MALFVMNLSATTKDNTDIAMMSAQFGPRNAQKVVIIVHGIGQLSEFVMRLAGIEERRGDIQMIIAKQAPSHVECRLIEP